MSAQEQKHRVRVSLDIHSIRNNNFQGNVYVKYSEVGSMGISKFKTPSTLQLFKKHIEEQYINEGFCSYEFDAAKDDLLKTLRLDLFYRGKKSFSWKSGIQTEYRKTDTLGKP